MRLSGGTKCMKYVLVIINILFFLVGAACLGVGIWAYVDKNKLHTLTKIGVSTGGFNAPGLLQTGALVLCVGGGIVLLLAFMGCCGAWKEVKCLLFLYGAFLIVIIVVEVAAVVLAVVFRKKFEEEGKKFLKESIIKHYEGKLDTSEPFSLGLDFAQVKFHCCGIDNYTDFENATKWLHRGNAIIPPTCCKLKSDDTFFSDPKKAELQDSKCPSHPSDSNSYWETSCWKSLYDFIKHRAIIIIAIAAAVLVLEVLCLVFACCLWSALRQEYI